MLVSSFSSVLGTFAKVSRKKPLFAVLLASFWFCFLMGVLEGLGESVPKGPASLDLSLFLFFPFLLFWLCLLCGCGLSTQRLFS